MVGHGECLHWFNFCQACRISNLGFPPHVIVRVLARPSATLPFLSAKAPVLDRFSPHVIVLNLGMFDLLRADMDPLLFADRFWHTVALLSTCMSGLRSTKFVLLGQLLQPRHLLPDRLYPNRVEAFHSRLLRHAESSHAFSLLFLGGCLGLFTSGLGNGEGLGRDATQPDLRCVRILNIIRSRVASVLAARSEYIFLILFIADVRVDP